MPYPLMTPDEEKALLAEVTFVLSAFPNVKTFFERLQARTADLETDLRKAHETISEQGQRIENFDESLDGLHYELDQRRKQHHSLR